MTRSPTPWEALWRKRGKRIDKSNITWIESGVVVRKSNSGGCEDIHAYASLPSLTQRKLSTRKTLEDEIYYLEHILPERNQKKIFQLVTALWSKTDKIIENSVDCNHRHTNDVLEIGYTCTQTIGAGVMYPARVLFDWSSFKELNLHKIKYLFWVATFKVNESRKKLGTLEARIRDRKDAQVTAVTVWYMDCWRVSGKVDDAYFHHWVWENWQFRNFRNSPVRL